MVLFRFALLFVIVNAFCFNVFAQDSITKNDDPNKKETFGVEAGAALGFLFYGPLFSSQIGLNYRLNHNDDLGLYIGAGRFFTDPRTIRSDNFKPRDYNLLSNYIGLQYKTFINEVLYLSGGIKYRNIQGSFDLERNSDKTKLTHNFGAHSLLATLGIGSRFKTELYVYLDVQWLTLGFNTLSIYKNDENQNVFGIEQIRDIADKRIKSQSYFEVAIFLSSIVYKF